MLSLLRTLVGKDGDAKAPSLAREPAPSRVEVAAAEPFVLADHIEVHEGFPYMRWDDVHAWAAAFPALEQAAAAWEACCNAWRLHLRDAMGANFRVDTSQHAAIVSSLDPREARAALEFMEKTRLRIIHVLKGIAQEPEMGRELLVIFDDEDAYYRYVARFYPAAGEFAFSGGMHIDDGASYYVTTKADLRSIEPVIAHEMTHGLVSHLPLPLWLNEGLAVNTEHRVAGAGSPRFPPQEMRAKHLKFWGDTEIQEFWSGKSFHRADDGNMLSYDLARLLIEHFSTDWNRFQDFANAATWEDAGAAAARKHLDVRLGVTVSALFEKETFEAWEPDSRLWGESTAKPEP